MPAQLVAADRATGISLAENVSQQRMHPADEYAAFSKLIAEGKAVDAVAAHFGIKAIDVERRMRLAKVAPALFDLYRQDKIDLDVLMALAATNDQKRQLAVWKSLPEWSRCASSVKRRMTEDEIKADDWRVKLIGLDRYKASGGTMRTDLFTEDAFLADAGLVELIVAEVLTEAADRLRAEGWAWVEVFETMGYEDREKFSKPPAKYLPETDKARSKREGFEAELARLESEYETLAAGDIDEDDERVDKIDTAIATVQAKLAALQAERLDTSSYDKSRLGAVVTSDSGVLKIMRGVMTAKEAKAESSKQAAVKRGNDPTAHAQAAANAPEFSEKLLVDLTSHRTMAVQALLTLNAKVALAVLADKLYGDLIPLGRGYGTSPVQVSARTSQGALERDATGLAAGPAAAHLTEWTERWRAIVPVDSAERLTWLLAQDEATVQGLLAYCTAVSIDMVQRRAGTHVHGDIIAKAVRLDMADWWAVGAENFLSQVPKAKITEVVSQVRGAEVGGHIAGMKKAEAVAYAVEQLAGARWLPRPLKEASAS